jgi:hypothetical protein
MDIQTQYAVGSDIIGFIAVRPGPAPQQVVPSQTTEVDESSRPDGAVAGYQSQYGDIIRQALELDRRLVQAADSKSDVRSDRVDSEENTRLAADFLLKFGV